jgi:hypothetical protein
MFQDSVRLQRIIDCSDRIKGKMMKLSERQQKVLFCDMQNCAFRNVEVIFNGDEFNITGN